LFFGEVAPSQFANQGGYDLQISAFNSGGGALQNATVTRAPSRRNSPVREFSDNLSWIKGSHSFNFGATAPRIGLWKQAFTVVPQVSFAISPTLDTAPRTAFNSLPATQVNNAAQLYNILAGRVSAFNGNARLSEDANKYTYLVDLII